MFPLKILEPVSYDRSSHWSFSAKKKVFLKVSQNSQEKTCARVSFLITLQSSTCNFIKKETMAQVLSCEFCEIFENTYFIEHLRTTTCEMSRFIFWHIALNSDFRDLKIFPKALLFNIPMKELVKPA